MLATLARITLLSFALYSGPAPKSPAQSAPAVITVIIPAALATNTPICAIS